VLSVSRSATIFVVDNAAEHTEAIHYATSRLNGSRNAAFFFLGERKNEWRQGQGSYSPKEFDGDTLSDPEINRLLDCLTRNSALGALADLDREIQFAIIRSKHQKDLLVTMREATEDKRFDAIIEDEYRGIRDDLSRRVYLAVCGFYQHGAYARDSLLAELVKTSLTRLYEETGAATEGVVIYDCIDPSAERYAARARHRTIATVVWERCGDPADKEQLLKDAIGLLNLTYRSDKEAFEQFIRSDRIVDTIRTLDGKIQFFDTACRKEPESPYVKQHYARMLFREEKLELALGQIDEALKINPSIRVLHHTRGVVLGKLATTTISDEIARRRLVQSEQAFRHGLSFYDRDEYFYQGLATVYLDWAKRVTDPESTEYINKAEGVISEGLRRAKVRDGLWIVSSEIENLLGHQPSRLKALEKAVAETPGSIIARYLLGKAYRKSGNPEKTIQVLEPVIKNHSEEFRACVEYALALNDLGEPYSKSIAVLRLGTLFGLNDPRFIATLGGMLFMNHEFSEAEKVFAETPKKELPYSEGAAIHFRPTNPLDHSQPFRLEGKVVNVRAGRALIQTEDYPSVACPLSRCKGIWMEPGLQITFDLVFCALRPLADRPARA
jgi:tetratricopeptide (TPR) repeat protein